MKDSRVLIGTWVAAIGIITYRSFHNGTGMPAPRSMFAANVVFSLLGVLSLASKELANTLAVGSLVGLLVTNSSVLGAAAKSVANASGQVPPTTTPPPTTTQIRPAGHFAPPANMGN